MNCCCEDKNRGDAQPGVLIEPRRGMIGKLITLVTVAVAYVTPVLAGVVSFLHPLRIKAQAGQFLRLATLDALPEDGTPRKFPVVMDRNDAWNRFAKEPVGAVYLRRVPGSSTVEAINVVCPHAGCFVEFQAKGDDKIYFCPCHNGFFKLSGERTGTNSPSPRDLDTLEVEIRNQNEVWVKYQNFRTGTPQKIADA